MAARQLSSEHAIIDQSEIGRVRTREGLGIMAMEVHVFFHGELPTRAALGQAFKNLSFPLSIESTTGSLEEHSGFMPMMVREEESGVEFDVFNDRDSMLELAGTDLDPRFDRMASFRWAGDETEMLAGLCASAALAKLTGGLVLDEADGKLRSAGVAIRRARKSLERAGHPAGQPRGGNRPADIKRYLKPLLEQRSDLVLVGRLLVIRPIRHLLRGVVFEPSGDKYSFRLWPLIKLLGRASSEGFSYADPIHEGHWKVWRPHFLPLLLDSLAEDVFARLGRLTTMSDLAAELAHNDQFPSVRVIALVLAGERDSAVAYIRELERRDPDRSKVWVAAQMRLLDRDIADVCAEFRAKEEATAKALDLLDAWQSAPFPAELPPGERPGRSAEPLFPIAPWIARPPWLIQEAPELPGEVRFAKDLLRRDGRVVLEVPLTSREAEDRHRNALDYTLVTRLPDGVLLLMSRITRWDPQDPYFSRFVPPPDWTPSVSLYLLVQSPSLHLLAVFFDERHSGKCPNDLLHLIYIDAYEPAPRRSVWHCSLYNGERTIHDDRSGERIYTKAPLTDADYTLTKCPMPPFAEFKEPLRRVHAVLQAFGFGEME